MREKSRGSEERLLAGLRSGDEQAFAALVDDLHGRLIALARTFTSSPTLGEDIVQETWLAVIRGLPGFEGRSSLSTWIYSILVRRARTLAAREARRAAPAPEGRDGDGVVEWEPGRGRAGLWEQSPAAWGLEDPAAIHQSREALEVVRAALEELPEAQRQVVLLRDVEAFAARDVCNILDLTETNERVLLHRGRARIRLALDRYVREGIGPASAAGSTGRSPRSARPGMADIAAPQANRPEGEARHARGGNP